MLISVLLRLVNGIAGPIIVTQTVSAINIIKLQVWQYSIYQITQCDIKQHSKIIYNLL